MHSYDSDTPFEDDDSTTSDVTVRYTSEYIEWVRTLPEAVTYEPNDERLREIAFEQEKTNAINIYVKRLQRLFFRDIRAFPKLKPALETLDKLRRGPPLNVFALPKPKIVESTKEIKQVKQYWVGSHSKFWQYALYEREPVMFEECILANIPMPLFFDIEMKVQMQEALTRSLYARWTKVVKEHLVNLGNEATELSDDQIESLITTINTVARSDFTDEECKSGLCKIESFVTQFLEAKLGLKCNFHIVSGCRKEKFSFHFVTKDLIVDSTVKSMPLLVFEIARAFQVGNLLDVVRDFDFEDDTNNANPEMRFMLRAIMLNDLVVFNEDNENQDPEVSEFTFRIADDTIFDEAVYSANHLLRAPGACKPGTAALSPVDANSPTVMVTERNFGNIFTHDDEGYRIWSNNLVTGPVADNVPCLIGMQPSDAYPRKRYWYAACNDDAIRNIDLSSYMTIRYREPRFVDIAARSPG